MLDKMKDSIQKKERDPRRSDYAADLGIDITNKTKLSSKTSAGGGGGFKDFKKQPPLLMGVDDLASPALNTYRSSEPDYMPKNL
jgi:hypothetical protein